MRRPPFLLSGRSPSASVPQGSFWWIWAGRFVLLVPPAPLVPAEAAASPWRQAPRGCLVPLTAAVRLWRRSSGCLRMGRPGPLKALVVSPWRRAPPRCLLQSLRVARTLGLRAVRPPSAFEVAGVTVVAETTGLLGAGPFGGVAGGGGGIIAVGNVGPTGAGGGGGITLLASMTGLSGARPAGGIDDVRPFRRRFGISAGFSTA